MQCNQQCNKYICLLTWPLQFLLHHCSPHDYSSHFFHLTTSLHWIGLKVSNLSICRGSPHMYHELGYSIQIFKKLTFTDMLCLLAHVSVLSTTIYEDKWDMLVNLVTTPSSANNHLIGVHWLSVDFGSATHPRNNLSPNIFLLYAHSSCYDWSYSASALLISQLSCQKLWKVLVALK